MTTVNSLDQSKQTYGIDEAIKQSVNVSDATQMENQFIALMVAQIQNQDPTNPVDSSQFLQQYSAMSQVKSLENMSELSKSNLVLLDNLQTLTASGLVGQEVKVAVSRVQLDAAPVKAQINLQHASSSTVLTLRDSNGVKTEIPLGAHAAGLVPFEIDPKAMGLEPGDYALEITTDAGEYPQIEISGLVSSVRVSANGPILDVVGAGSVPFYDITEFGQASLSGLL